jgi:hypothetical protein
LPSSYQEPESATETQRKARGDFKFEISDFRERQDKEAAEKVKSIASGVKTPDEKATLNVGTSANRLADAQIAKAPTP